ncbi:hypothetical protein P3T76_011748 [Phytophthora citrophthora]|uniref:Uncharacterized protein n=1 Tax=Phytophthora citrophthora TaxID=4793 RepID=A0AAD9G8W2_9STRA|nr:hypothetical protein P3T76_011748 [Phytophthora citrophthora]
MIYYNGSTNLAKEHLVQTMIPPNNTKLIRHRWDLHALQALSKRDPYELVRVFTELKDLPASAVNTQAQTFGFGAPMQFHTFGFFDKTSTHSSSALFDHVVDGDTMLLLALRHYDPKSAIALIKLGASIHITNSDNENPLQSIFDAMAFLRLHSEGSTQEQSEVVSNGDRQLLQQREEYGKLFSLLDCELTEFYDKQKADVEKELLELYHQFAPERVAKIQTQLQTFVYREKLLLETVKRKYML